MLRPRYLIALFALALVAGCNTGSDRADLSNDSSTTATISSSLRDNSLNVGVVSYRDLPFTTVKRQTYDYSCGSAAVATLLSYVYGMPATEKQVFKEMFETGDQEKIKKEGFSMLDMANYLSRQDLKAVGYKLTLEASARNKIPFIALINKQGYHHFVVVKSVRGNKVLVGDSNAGNVAYDREEFRKMWGNGIALVVTNQARKARTAFVNPKEWRYVRMAALSRNQTQGFDDDSFEHGNWQVAPGTMDIFYSVTESIDTGVSGTGAATDGGTSQ